MIPNEKSPCINCRLIESDGMNLKCKAFPDGIHDDILSGINKHTKPCCGQKNDIVFEPIEYAGKEM